MKDRSSSAERSLRIYLNDHLAGAAAGVALADRVAEENAGSEFGSPLRRLSKEIREDRQELVAIMAARHCPANRAKVAVGWCAEKLGRVKLNGRRFRYSPLSRLEELELLAAGVRTKESLWRALAASLPQREAEATGLERLAERAAEQLTLIQDVHARAAELALGSRAESQWGAPRTGLPELVETPSPGLPGSRVGTRSASVPDRSPSDPSFSGRGREYLDE